VLKAALFTILKNTSAVTALLSTYSGAAAIFTCREIPPKCTYPAIILHQPGGSPFDTREFTGGDITIDVSVFDDKTDSDKAVSELAYKVWNALNRCKPVISGYAVHGVVATPPREVNDSDSFPGYIISVKCTILKNV
jgi:hypothetical protein